MATPLAVIESALGNIGRLAAGETVSAEDADVCLKQLNVLVDSLEQDGLFGYTTVDTVVTLPASTSSLTIGPAQQIDMVRPVRLLPGCFTRVNGYDYKLTPVDEAYYNSIAIKSDIESVAPSVCFFDGGTPTGIVYFWPEVSNNAEVHLFTPEQGGQAPDLYTSYVFPPGYQNYLEHALTVAIARKFGVPVDPYFVTTAAHLKRTLRTENSRVPELDMEGLSIGVNRAGRITYDV